MVDEMALRVKKSCKNTDNCLPLTGGSKSKSLNDRAES